MFIKLHTSNTRVFLIGIKFIIKQKQFQFKNLKTVVRTTPMGYCCDLLKQQVFLPRIKIMHCINKYVYRKGALYVSHVIITPMPIIHYV